MSGSATAAAAGSSLLSIKMQQKAKEEEERVRAKRKRGAVVLMLQFLQECGFARSLDALQQESGVSLKQYVPADNIDLLSTIAQFEDYFEFRFARRPKFFRLAEGEGTNSAIETAVDGGEKVFVRKRGPSSDPLQRARAATAAAASAVGDGSVAASSAPPQHPNSGRPPAATPPAAGLARGNSGRVVTLPEIVPKAGSSPSTAAVTPPSSFAFSAPAGPTISSSRDPAAGPLDAVGGRAIALRKAGAAAAATTTTPETESGDEGSAAGFQGRLGLRAPPRFENAELAELASLIHRDILDSNPSVSWDAIAELGTVKQLLKEAVVMPIKYPQLFSGILRPWRGILLFGPPGTGKTMLAKAVATECRTTFFNISASTIVSKWRGDSEKMVRMLFELAVHYAPSTIFLDEIDSVMSARSSDGSEHEGSRRMKTELLIQMDGLSKRKGGDVVFVLAASNVPWDLDGAILRRLEKRVHVGLPSLPARKDMFRRNLKSVAPDFDFDAVARGTEGYSGADVDVVCREATMRTIRVLIEKLEANKDLSSAALAVPVVTTQDVLSSIQCTRSSASTIDPAKYGQWEKQFGSTMS